MDIGMLIDNNFFYDGFEDESEVELFIAEKPEFDIHIWIGYIRDIFDKPIFDGNEWTGFTRDYQQEVGTYENNNVTINVDEYLFDLMKYKDKKFKFEETLDCFNLIKMFLKYAKQENLTVKVNWW